MKILTITFSVVVLILVIFVLQSCIGVKPEKEDIVRKKCNEYLKNKYEKDFKITKYKQFFHGGHWRYETDMEAYPLDNESLIFAIKYDAKNKSIKSDNYKKAYWENQIERELRPIIEEQFRVLDFKAKLSRNGSIGFLNSNLEFYPDYQEMIKNIKLPVLHLTIRLEEPIEKNENELACFVKLNEVLAKKAFVKNEFQVYFFNKKTVHKNMNNLVEETFLPNDSLCSKKLWFKLTDKLLVPQIADLKKLVVIGGKDSLFKKNKILFDKAEKDRQENNTEKALETYLKIVSSVSDYRYSTYAPAEAAYSIESAFYAAEILEKQNKTEQAQELYQDIVRRMEYEEVRLNLSDYYKNARQKIDDMEK